MSNAVRDWATVDYYAELGVSREATGPEITKAYRSRAKQLHPDALGHSFDRDRFNSLTTAYEVLSDPSMRDDYDRVERRRTDGVRERPVRPMGTVPRPAATPMIRWTPRRAFASIALGIVFLLAGVGTTAALFTLKSSESRQAAGRYEVAAIAVQSEGAQVQLGYRDRDNVYRTTAVPPRVNAGVVSAGEQLDILVAEQDPFDIIANETHAPRDITIGFVIVKFFVGGPVLIMLGRRRRRELAASATAVS